MGAIEDFISRYRREFDFYYQSARLVAQLLEARLVQKTSLNSLVRPLLGSRIEGTERPANPGTTPQAGSEEGSGSRRSASSGAAESQAACRGPASAAGRKASGWRTTAEEASDRIKEIAAGSVASISTVKAIPLAGVHRAWSRLLPCELSSLSRPMIFRGPFSRFYI
jgi:hypothetical protein